MHIFRLSKDNLVELRALLCLFVEVFEEEHGEKPPSDAYLLDRLADPHTIILVHTESDGVVVGGLVAYVLQRFQEEQSEIYLYDLAVHPDFRRRGIARALIMHLQGIAAVYSAPRIFVQAHNEDQAALALYREFSSGENSEVTHFDIPTEIGKAVSLK